MRILHLSDFHFKGADKDIATQSLLIDRLIDDLKSYPHKIDLFLFTGDLVFSGKKSQDFEDAYNALLKRIGQELSIPKTNVFFCCGNHDVDRSKVSSSIKDYIRRFTNADQLNQFVEGPNKTDFLPSCAPTTNFFEFQKKFYEKGVLNKSDFVTQLFSVHFRSIDNLKIGIVTINTAWCSTGDDDANNLFFPLSELEKAISQIKMQNVDWRILLLHHPLNDLRNFNKIELEDLIYSEFDFMFAGHLHKREDFIRLMQNDGIFGSHSFAAFTKKSDGKVGYSIVDFNIDTLEISLSKKMYDFEERIFLSLPEMRVMLPCNDQKSDQIKILKTLKKRLNEALEKANELCVNSKDFSFDKGFMDLFVDPVLKTQPQVDAAATLARGTRIKISNLYNTSKNYLVYGKDKTGKTSLLFKILIDHLSNYSGYGIIPVYIDLSEYKSDSKKFDIIRIISKYIEHTTNQTKEILANNKLKLLVDNFDPSRSELIELLASFFQEYRSCSYVFIGDQTLAQSFEKIDFGLDGYDKLFIHDISRNEIRQFAKRWPSIPAKKSDEFVERIVEVLNQHSMPFNFWTLSIFLWIYSGKNTLNFNSNSELLELYIDDILDRNQLAADPQNRFSYQNYKVLLAELAHKLLREKLATNYSIPYYELIAFVEDFKSKNPRRVGRTSDIVEHLLAKGVLKKLEEDYVTFRLNGVFEYFIAYSFIDNRDFFDEIVADDNVYLSFKNEFEIYSGFSRSEVDNKQLLQKISDKTRKIFVDLNNRMEGSLDKNLLKAVDSNDALDLSNTLSGIVTSENLLPLNEKEKDDFLDSVNERIVRNVEVKPKKIYDTSIKKFDILEKYLIINARVFKNIDNINDVEYVNGIFDFIVESSCNLGFLLIEEIQNAIDEKKMSELDYSSPHKLIFQLISNYLPSIVQTFIHDAVGHVNLESIIMKNIDSLKFKSEENQFKLFILYSLLLDIDLKKHKTKIDDLINISKMGLIKSSILIKMIYLLLFKSYDDDNMISFLKEKMRQISLSINPKADMKDFDQRFEKTKKILLLKRNQ